MATEKEKKKSKKPVKKKTSPRIFKDKNQLLSLSLAQSVLETCSTKEERHQFLCQLYGPQLYVLILAMDEELFRRRVKYENLTDEQYSTLTATRSAFWRRIEDSAAGFLFHD